MKELWRARAQNGRSGIALVGDHTAVLPSGKTVVVGEGSLRSVGIVAGMATFEFVPGLTGTWVLIAKDCKVHGGASVVETQSLQGNDYASLLLLSQDAVVEHYGYKRRESRIVAYSYGCEIDIPSTVLAAMGLVKSEEGTVVEVPSPPALSGAMASAFAALKKA